MRVKRLEKNLNLVVAIVALTLMSTGCQEKNKYVPPPPPAVTVSRPVQQAVTDYIEFTGTTEALELVEIRARVEGYLESIHFKDGAKVKRGALLFVIDPKPFQAKLGEAKAGLLIRQAELKLAETTLKRKEGAFKDKAVSEVEVIQARAEQDKARAAVEAAQAAMETTRLNLSYTKIHAPISGRMGRNLVDVGNLVGANERTLLATIVQDDPIYAYFNASERDLLQHRQKRREREVGVDENNAPNAYLGLANEEGYPHEGRVDYIDNRVNADTGTIQLRAVFPNSDGVLLPGLFARIRIPTSEPHTALLVPDRALGTDQQGRFLLVVNDKNVVEYRTVKIGAKVEGVRVIESGISSADRVIVNGIQRARPGATVNSTEAEAQISATSGTTRNSKQGD